MHLLQIILIIVALLIVVFWFQKGYQQTFSKDEPSNLPAIILAVWIVASAVFGTHFFVLRIAGVFDITLERLLFVGIILFLPVGLLQGKVSFQKTMTIEMVMGIFLLICILSMMRTGFLPSSPDFPSPWFIFISGYFFPFIVFVFAKNYIVGERDVMVILHALFYFGIYLSITAFFEYFELRQFVFPRYINDPEISPLHMDRARGPFLNSAFNGVGILTGFISGLHLLQRKSGFAKLFHLLALLLFFPAVFFTQTRSVYLGLLITVIVFLGWYRTAFSKWKLISLPLTVVFIFGIANSPRLFSQERREGGVYQVEEAEIRMALLQRSLHLFSGRPIMGVGLAQFVPASLHTRTGRIPFIAEEAGLQFQHNHLLGIMTELGTPGFLVYLILIMLILRRLKQLSGYLPETGIMGNNLLIIILAVWCVYLINNMFIEPSNCLFANAVPFLFAGLADGMYTRSLRIADSSLLIAHG